MSRVDIGARRVEIGRLDDVMVSKLRLSDTSLTFAREALSDGTALWVQCSAHGRPRQATLRHDGGWRLEFNEPIRPVAPGQTVVFYSVDDEEVVQGAALVGQ